MQTENSIVVIVPSTVYISFPSEMPKLFVVYSSDGIAEYFRYMDGKTPRIKFNLPVEDTYTCNVPFDIVKIVTVEIPALPQLPPPERDRYKGEPDIIYDENWTESVASCFTDENIIVHGPAWAALIPPIRIFIDLHEVGHMFYVTEEFCDLFAYVNFMRMGYNRSTAFFSLSKVLKQSEQSVNRIRSITDVIKKTTGEFSSE